MAKMEQPSMLTLMALLLMLQPHAGAERWQLEPDIDGRMAELIIKSDEDLLTDLDRLEMEKFGWLRPPPIYLIIPDDPPDPIIASIGGQSKTKGESVS